MGKYVILDLEMCKVMRDKREEFGFKNELIQIGAVLVDENLEIKDTFMTYVKPQYGRIDSFIRNLTGITDSHVADAPFSEEAIKMFTDWIPESDDVQMVSWSETDKAQISAELQGKNIHNERMAELLDKWIDCQLTFGQKRDNAEHSYKLSEALIIAGIYYDEGEHDALVDAKNTAQLFIKMEKEPDLKLSTYFTSESSSGFNLGNIKTKPKHKSKAKV